ncbi:hypothetical protein [Tardiphaga sp. 285_C5_N1_2]|uniref:hypothetical protein n=1 Tax=Tardiphaga sp. 285_C5_N1_2 TaxID=3240775 RepID=UPI003F88CA32
MTTTETIGYTLIAVLVAVIVERLVSHFARRNADEISRLEVAAKSMADQREAIEALFRRDTVPEVVKQFVLDSAEAALKREGAMILLDILSGKKVVERSDEDSADYKEFCDAVEYLQEHDTEAFEIYCSYIYRAPVMAVLQRAETCKALAELSLRIASERQSAATRDAVAMRGSVFAPFIGLRAA